MERQEIEVKNVYGDNQSLAAMLLNTEVCFYSEKINLKSEFENVQVKPNSRSLFIACS